MSRTRTALVRTSAKRQRASTRGGSALTWIATSIGVGALLWWLKRKTGADLGVALPSWATPWKAKSEAELDVGIASRRMIRSAESGIPLSSYRQAEDHSLMLPTATTNVLAYFKSAYWLAVASRLQGVVDKELIDRADENQRIGAKYQVIPGYITFGKGDVSRIYRAAGVLVASRANLTGNRELAAVAAILQQQARPESVAVAQRAASDRSPVSIAAGTVAGSIQTANRGAQIVKGIFTGERPPGMGAFQWWSLKWGVRVGGLLALVITARLLFASEYVAAREAVGGAVEKVRSSEEWATAKQIGSRAREGVRQITARASASGE